MTSHSFACVAVPAPIRQLLREEPIYRFHQTLIIVISKLHHGPRHVSRHADVRFKLLASSGTKRESSRVYAMEIEKMVDGISDPRIVS